uniref:Small ribosomal subunit protein uS15c n=1 Tax=Viscum crassulae TaxID=1522199 RepID=A0A0M4FMM2_9MAGN|nr:ribosomal protein S15 [Viscum crassulae]ALC75154.1 ribosomal protein S15 [Viscum crassulae]
MIKNLLFLIILKKEKSGSVQFQILNLTTKIRKLTSHLELHRKDYFSKRSLLKILGKRQRLMDYLLKKKG